MKRGLAFLTTGAIVWGFVAQFGYAQRGLGEPGGIARQDVKPTVVVHSGTVLKVESEPCKLTTGRAYAGTHFLLKTPQGEELNMHLGPAGSVEYVSEQLSVGEQVTVSAFRTEKMPKNHYVAKSVTIDSRTIVLRDEALRPQWAGNRLATRGQGPGWGQRRGWGRGGRTGGRGWRNGWGY